MSEKLELRLFSKSNRNESDIEYHEIRDDGFLEDSLLSSQMDVNPRKEYDFFTQFDVKSTQKAVKKKKVKKKDISCLMEIISSELAVMELPLEENVINKIDYSKDQESYLQKPLIFQKLLRIPKTSQGDAENGRRYKDIDLNPIFPRVLENATAKDKTISVQYVEPVLFGDIITEYQEYETKETPKFLEISLRDITFSHHHNFSLEKLLCIKLIDCYKEYCDINKEIKETLRNIEINKKTRDNLKQQLSNIVSTTKEDLRFDQTVLKYTGKFLQLKDKYYQLLNTEKESQHKVVSLWADIEMVRQKFGTTNTAYVVEITNTVLDDDDYERVMTNVFEIEFSDMLDRIEYDYVTKYLEYKKMKHCYKSGERVGKKILKPKLHIDQDKLKDEVENIVTKIVTKEKTDIKVKEDKNMLKSLSSTQTSTHKYHFKIYVDNVFVCESESITSPILFNWIEFIDTLSIQILPNNEVLSIFLCEDDIKVASVMIIISDVRISSSNANFYTHIFISRYTVESTAKLVGSGFDIKTLAAKAGSRLKSSNMFKGKLYTTAKVSIKTGWSDKLNDNQFDSIQESMKLGRQLKRLMHGNDKPNVGILTDIIEKIYDRNINNDINIKHALHEACTASTLAYDMFSIDADSPEMIRLKLLHLRNCGGFNDVVDNTIPIFPSQISTKQLTCLQNSEENDLDLQVFEGNSEVDPIDVQRFMSIRYVEKLNANLQRSLSKYLLKKTYKDVVRDFKDLSLRGIFSNQSNFDLETTSSLAKQRSLKECLTKDQEISIVVLRASSLLDRSTEIISEELNDVDSIAGFKVRPLRPFVRVSYHGISVQTLTGIGCHPTWNQTMKIKTKFSPLSSIYLNVYDECKEDISEAYSEEVLSSHSRAVHYRYCNRWLGTVQIPLFSVLSLGSLCGTFKITSPPLIFGYDASDPKNPKSAIPEVIQLMKKESSFLTLNISTNLAHLSGFHGYMQPVPDSEDDLIIKNINIFATNYLNELPGRNISLTFIDSLGRNKCVTEFLQPIPLPDPQWFPKNPKMEGSAISKSSSSKSGKRKPSVSTHGEDKETESVAPDSLWKDAVLKGDQLLKLIDAAVRYVALIPTYEVTESHVATLTGAELLKVLCGSPIDHSLLLASYFLHLGIRCWVITGLALPRGLSSYVLVKCEQRNKAAMIKDPPTSRGFLSRSDSKQFTWFLYDAVAGGRFELRDAGCPLKSVIYVFDSDNIWVNIQTSQDLENVSLDFSKSSDWQRVFEDPPFIMKLPSLSVEGLYSAPPHVEQLRSALEGKVKNKIQRWRSHIKTIWNRYCGSLLREMLPSWEYWAFNPTEPRPMPGQRLKQFMVSYKMFGFPLNMPYTNAKSVISRVKAAGIHLHDDLDVEFALAVDVYAYPNNVLSVWVFLSSITKI